MLVRDNSGRLPALDGMRGIAILLVLIWHYFVGTLQTEPHSIADYAVACLGLTWTGVDLFFVLSGFLIGGILLDQRRSNGYFKTFYVRRICRIFPAYVLLLILFVALLPLESMLPWLLERPLPLLSYVTFTQNFVAALNNDFGPHWLGITWSLAVEGQFYLLLPFVIRYCSYRRLPWFLSLAIATAVLLRLALYYGNGPGTRAPYVLMPCRADALLLGVLLAWMLRQPTTIRVLTTDHAKNTLHAALFVLLAGAAFLTIKDPSITSFGMISLGYTWMALLYSCFLLIVLTQKDGVLHTIANNLLLRRLGTIAYGVYLLHQGMLGLTHGLILHQEPGIVGVDDALITLFALALTLTLATLSYHYFESRIIQMGHAFRYQDACSPVIRLTGMLRRSEEKA